MKLNKNKIMKTESVKATLIMVRTDETGEHRDYCDEHNNHRITVVRMGGGHVGLRFSALPTRPGFPYNPVDERTEVVTPYPLAGALPSYAEAHSMWMASKGQ